MRDLADCPLGKTINNVLRRLLVSTKPLADQVGGSGVKIVAMDSKFISPMLLSCLLENSVF